jgi:hypothetical protein
MRAAHGREFPEEAMLAPRNAPIALERRTLLGVRDGAGQTILCLKGMIWLTQQNDVRDIVLSAGESFTLDRPGLALLYALRSSYATILGPAPRVGRTISLQAAPGR